MHFSTMLEKKKTPNFYEKEPQAFYFWVPWNVKTIELI